jgi:hypothetical protein
MILGSRNQCKSIHKHEPQVKVKNEVIESVSLAKNLGLLMDAELRFMEHIKQKARNAFYKLKILYEIREFLSENSRITLVESLILSQFNYCDTVYGPRLYIKTENVVQRVQNACARFCFNIPKRARVTPFLNKSGILKMAARRTIHLASQVFNIINRKMPKYLYEKLRWSGESHPFNTRSRVEVKLAIPKHKTQNFKGSFSFAASKFWYDLPPPMRQKTSS